MQNLFVIESRGQRVLTSAQIADCYNTTVDCIKQNFHANRSRYVERKHYIALTGSELREFKNKVRIPDLVKNENKNEVRIPHPAEIKAQYQFDTQFKYAKSLYLWTEKGALLHAKSLNTDKAWEVYDYLVDFYFRVKEEKKVEEKKEVVPTETTVKPFKGLKAATGQVVDIPENRKAQELISDMKKYITGMEALLDIYNMYLSEEGFKNIAETIREMNNKISTTAHFLSFLKPNIVTKYL